MRYQIEKWKALFLAASPTIFLAGWFYWRGYICPPPEGAEWFIYINRGMLWVMILSTLITLFVFPVPKRQVRR